MRSSLLALLVLTIAPATRAQEPPPAPLEPPPTTEVAPADQVPPLAPAEQAPVPIEPPSEGRPPDFTPAPKPAKPQPTPDEVNTGFGGDACWGSTVGCLGAGCLPGAGTALGAGILIGSISAGLAEGGCGGVLLVLIGTVYGVAIGAPSALLLGPCASCGAIAGGATAALLNDRELMPVVLGGLPGLALSLLGTGGIVWGLLSFEGAAEPTVPIAILATSVAVSLLSGPATIAGMVVADGMQGADATAPQEKPTPKPAALPADLPADPRADQRTTQVAMRY